MAGRTGSDSDADDDDAALALSIVDGAGGDSVSSPEREIVEQLEGVRSLVRAFDSLNDPEGRMPAPPMARWGPFILREEVGRGGFGIVCRGFDPATDREIAVKLYRGRELPAEPRLAGQVRHNNVVGIYGAAVHEGRPGIWMEFVHGRTLADRVQGEGPLSPAETTRVGIALCQALSAVHAAGVVHQDLKPRNVMEERGGRIVLMDFGSGLSSREMRAGGSGARFSGTPLFMAPEVIGGAMPTVASDVYSLGVLLFYLLTGTYPVYATNLQELTRLHERQRGASARRFATSLRDLRPDVSASLAERIGRALAPGPERIATPAALQAALEATATGQRGRAARRGIVIGAFVALASAAVVFRLTHPPRPVPASLPPRALHAIPEAPAADGPAPAAFEVEAALVARRAGGDRRLRNGDRVAVGDRLQLSVTGSRALHFYVVNEDERGSAHLLFPMADCTLLNPIGSGRHRLPGVCGGADTAWEVSSSGGREHFLVLASPMRLVQVEARLAGMAAPLREGGETTRAVGQRAPLPDEPRGAVAFRDLAEIARSEVAARTRAEGVWAQEIVLENPAR